MGYLSFLEILHQSFKPRNEYYITYNYHFQKDGRKLSNNFWMFRSFWYSEYPLPVSEESCSVMPENKFAKSSLFIKAEIGAMSWANCSSRARKILICQPRCPFPNIDFQTVFALQTVHLNNVEASWNQWKSNASISTRKSFTSLGRFSQPVELPEYA